MSSEQQRGQACAPTSPRTLRGAGVLAVLVACSSTPAPQAKPANPCATVGATYEVSFVEQAGGTCGPVPSAIVNISPDGTVAGSQSVSCATVTQEGCTAHDSGCTFAGNGTTCTGTTDVTFAADGSGATGLETISCSNASASCTSTYNTTETRQ
jgi:hypothetical protein